MEVLRNVVCSNDLQVAVVVEMGSEKQAWVSDSTHSEGRKEEFKHNHFPAVGQMAAAAAALHLSWAALPAGLRADEGRTLGGGEKGGS